MDSNPLLMIGVMVAFGVAMNFMRLWSFVSGNAGNRRAKMARITDMDAHLSFDERIAERMRELEKDGASGLNIPTAAPVVPDTPFASPAPVAPPQGFGRRGL